MRKQLVEKMGRVNALEKENSELRLRLDSPSDYAEEMMLIKDENRDLKVQIIEMEEFLRDYGLEWVGKQAGNENNTSTDHKKTASANVEYKAFARKVDELNAMLSSEPAQVKVLAPCCLHSLLSFLS